MFEPSRLGCSMAPRNGACVVCVIVTTWAAAGEAWGQLFEGVPNINGAIQAMRDAHRKPSPVERVDKSLANRAECDVADRSRFSFHLRKDEHEARTELNHLKQQRQYLIRFLNGMATARSHSAMRKSMQDLEQTPAMQSLLAQYVPAQGGRTFQSLSPTFRILLRDGSFTEPPTDLLCEKDDSPVQTARRAFGQRWSETLEILRSSRSVSPEHIGRLRHTLQVWEQAADLQSLPAERKIPARRYLKAIAAVISAVENPDMRQELRSFIVEQGFVFPGGTVAELLHYLLDHKMAPRYGSPAQLVISQFGRDLVGNLDGQIGVLENRIANYKSQNPTVNGALSRTIAGAGVPPQKSAFTKFYASRPTAEPAPGTKDNRDQSDLTSNVLECGPLPNSPQFAGRD